MIESSVQPGSLVALFVSKYEDEIPQIGQKVSMPSETDVEIEWWVGTYSGPWKKDCIPGHSFYPRNVVSSLPPCAGFFPVELTKSRRISRSAKDRLVQAYSSLEM